MHRVFFGRPHRFQNAQSKVEASGFLLYYFVPTTVVYVLSAQEIPKETSKFTHEFVSASCCEENVLRLFLRLFVYMGEIFI